MKSVYQSIKDLQERQKINFPEEFVIYSPDREWNHIHNMVTLLKIQILSTGYVMMEFLIANECLSFLPNLILVHFCFPET